MSDQYVAGGGGMPLGVETGFRAVDDAVFRQQQTRQSAATTAHTLALAEQARFEGDLKGDNLLRQQQFQALAQSMVQGQRESAEVRTPSDYASQMMREASVFAKAGFREEADKRVTQASSIYSHAAAAAKTVADQQRAELEEERKSFERVKGWLSLATDQTSLNALLLSADAQGMRMPPEFRQMVSTYSPALFDQLRYGTEQGLKAVEAKRKALHDSEMEEARQARRAQRDAEIDLKREREERAAEKAARDAKNAGANASRVISPNSKELAEAEALVADAFPDLTPDVTLGKDKKTTSASVAMANEARLRMSKNPAISFTEALNQSFLEAQTRGDFTKTPETGGWNLPIVGRVGGEKAKDKFNYKGEAFKPRNSEEKPMPTSRSEVVIGDIYTRGTKRYRATTTGMEEID